MFESVVMCHEEVYLETSLSLLQNRSMASYQIIAIIAKSICLSISLCCWTG